jgi:hypothetical protein
MASTAAPVRLPRRSDTAALEVALLERALADGGLLFTKTAPGVQYFYRLILHPTLFGGIDLVREWGRMAPDPDPTRLVRHYECMDEVLPVFNQVVGVRLRHGYRARALPARFIPSAAAVYWCPADPRAAALRDG